MSVIDYRYQHNNQLLATVDDGILPPVGQIMNIDGHDVKVMQHFWNIAKKSQDCLDAGTHNTHITISVAKMTRFF